MTTTTVQPDPVEKHRREVRWKIVAPIVVAALLVIVLGAVFIVEVAANALVFEQVSVVTGILATPFILLPLVLLCVVPYLIAAVLAIGVGKVYARTRPAIRSTRRFTERVTARTHQTMPRLARPLVSLNTRLSRWEHTLVGWQRSSLEVGKDQSHE